MDKKYNDENGLKEVEKDKKNNNENRLLIFLVPALAVILMICIGITKTDKEAGVIPDRITAEEAATLASLSTDADSNSSKSDKADTSEDYTTAKNQNGSGEQGSDENITAAEENVDEQNKNDEQLTPAVYMDKTSENSDAPTSAADNEQTGTSGNRTTPTPATSANQLTPTSQATAAAKEQTGTSGNQPTPLNGTNQLTPTSQATAAAKEQTGTSGNQPTPLNGTNQLTPTKVVTAAAEKKVTPIPSLPPTPGGISGTFSGTALVDDGAYCYYTVTVKVTYANGLITDVVSLCGADEYDSGADTTNANCNQKALNVLKTQIIKNQGTSGCDVVSGATYSSKAIALAAESAIKNAK